MGIYDDLPLPSTEQTIRLLRLEPAEKRRVPLTGELFVVSLETNPEYAAVSYCWGSPTSTCPVTCNGFSLAVSKNLGLALSSIRSLSSFPLWIDQICINQDDLRERSAQVAFMRRIYSQAIETFAYLGEPDSDITNEACEVIKKISIPVLHMSHYQSDESDLTTLLRASVATVKLAVQHPYLTKRAYDKDVRSALSRLIESTYFSRKWIIQEVVVSRPTFCLVGIHRFKWDPFISAILKQRGSAKFQTEAKIAIKLWWLCHLVIDFGHKRRSPLLTLLYYSPYFQAADPRDYVFALLGIASDSDDFPKPNYETAVEQVYHKISSCFIQQGKGYLMLHLVGMRPTNNGLPSWVVDWRCFDTFYPGKHYASFCAGGRDGRMELTPDALIIRACGKIVDHIVAVGDPFKAEQNLWDRLAQYIDNCTDTFAEFYEGNTGHQAIQRDLASLISFDMRFDDRHPNRKLFTFNEDNCDLVRCWDLFALDDASLSQIWLMQGRYYLKNLQTGLSKTAHRIGVHSLSRLFQWIQPGESPRLLAEFEVIRGVHNTNAEENLLRWNFFKPTTRPVMTQSCRLGLAPALTQKGDVVCVLFGANAPFILRPSNDGTYKIVGEAYVRDIMFGETLKDDRYPVQEILIS
ncbi:hypothetical protein GJ744_010699 [Endocarpon pusillum]|uniref:Heterokaryon incompatibility domain-containing protein n=1 Tax=Endocarpon pusillum TaxID=364733 RepID=A0A8H7AI14_9EURO|nr:hypothetical protein GJ744_010699 [Endocarpon pusillum]